MVCPFCINASNERSNFLISWKCNPVVGSSKINSNGWAEFSFNRNDANFTRWLSPPESVEEDCPSFT